MNYYIQLSDSDIKHVFNIPQDNIIEFQKG